jgi:hypothetical protein
MWSPASRQQESHEQIVAGHNRLAIAGDGRMVNVPDVSSLKVPSITC